MNASNPAIPAGRLVVPSSPSVFTTGGFWEYLWRTSGLQFWSSCSSLTSVDLRVISPQVHASA